MGVRQSLYLLSPNRRVLTLSRGKTSWNISDKKIWWWLFGEQTQICRAFLRIPGNSQSVWTGYLAPTGWLSGPLWNWRMKTPWVSKSAMDAPKQKRIENSWVDRCTCIEIFVLKIMFFYFYYYNHRDFCFKNYFIFIFIIMSLGDIYKWWSRITWFEFFIGFIKSY